MVRNPPPLTSTDDTRADTGAETDSTTDRANADLRHATDVLGDRWLLLLIGALAGGPRRFGELSDDLRGVAPNVLTERLRRAQRAGLITGRAYQHRPRRLAYDLTSAGRDAARVLPALAAWSTRRRNGEPARHPACGTAMELRWWCPECDATEESHDGGLGRSNGPDVSPLSSPTAANDDRRGDQDGVVWV